MADSTRANSLDMTSLEDNHHSPQQDDKKRDPLNPIQPDQLPIPQTDSDPSWRKLGLAFEGLGVKGFGGQAKMVEDLPVSLLRMWDVVSWVRKLTGIQSGPTSWIIKDFYGMADPGETMLVLGRPGSGCSTLLRALSNEIAAFARPLEGNLQFSNIPSSQASRLYQAQIVYNSEEDIHLPELSVRDTLAMANWLKTPKNLTADRKTHVTEQVNKLLDAFGMPHTASTYVGNEVVRGVSGGERKRVSLAEVLSTNPAIACWDNSTRGLDSAVALHYIRILRQLSRQTGMTNVVTIYQASQNIYECFDRVVVLYDGQMVFSGRASDAESFFLQWFVKHPRTTTPDFLTGCTSPTERQVRSDLVGPAPLTASDMATAFRNSPYFEKLTQDITEFKQRAAGSSAPRLLEQSVRDSKQTLAGRGIPYTANIFQQTAACIRRQIRLTLNSSSVIITQAASIIMNAVFTGAILYKPPASAEGSFQIAGGLFFIIIYFTIMGFGEVPNAIGARPLLIKHRKLGFYHPVAQILGQVTVDVPLYAFYSMIFSALFYFMLGLSPAAEQFFTMFFIIMSAYLTISVMFRLIAAWSPNMTTAIRYSATALSLTLTVSGFGLPAGDMLGWASWMRRIAVPPFALEALIGNEFKTRTLVCAETDLVPNGPGYTDLAYQTCSILGAQPGSNRVAGSTYMDLKYEYLVSNVWRNVGILWAMYLINTAFLILGSNLTIRDSGSVSTKVFKRGAAALKRGGKDSLAKQHDPEASAGSVPPSAATDKNGSSAASSMTHQETEKQHAKIESAGQPFTFENVSYTVTVDGKDRKLLDNVSGYVRPGRLSALMGASGAGKTTLLDTISQRKTTGVVEGTFLVGGKPLVNSFGRRTGFVMQGDIHEPYATVRECLQFSALLRQPESVSREDKLAYAEEVLHLLELEPLADALIGAPGIGGLGVEERKRVTIGVELAAKPDFLLFLDEPTSGLDSQAAFEIVRFLRKIANEGIAVMATIHQPSADLFAMFDEILLLAPGGKTVYAGEVGQGGKKVLGYFERQGVVPPPEVNPAEFIIETVAPVGGSKTDFAVSWNQSPEAAEITATIQALNAEPTTNDGGAAAQLTQAERDDQGRRFASTWKSQVRELCVRMWRAQLRNGSYITSRMVNFLWFGLFISFFFYKTPGNLQAPQSLSLCLLILVQVVPPTMIDISQTYFHNFELFLGRERNGIYDWTAMMTAHTLVEIPFSVVGAILLFFCSNWTYSEFGPSASTSGLLFVTWVSVGIFTAVSGVLLGSASSDPFAASFVLSFFWNLMNSMSGVIRSLPSMTQPFRALSWITPLRYLYASMVSTVIGPIPIFCRDFELVTFRAPAGETCRSYVASFLANAPGYLQNDSDPNACGYCPMSYGESYVESIGYAYEHRWRDWGIFLIFILVNVILSFAFTWYMRIRPLTSRK